MASSRRHIYPKLSHSVLGEAQASLIVDDEAPRRAPQTLLCFLQPRVTHVRTVGLQHLRHQKL